MKAVLDANVLFPTILREILTDLAAMGLYQPLWSARILAEWRHAATRLGPDQEAMAGAEIALLAERFPDAAMPDDGTRAIDLHLPDPADRHVIEAALAGGAKQIVTANLRDFPRPVMAGLGLRAIHPDAFLLDLHRRDAASIANAVQTARDKAARMGGEMTVTEMLKRSRLPRLAKALKG
ncbi:RSP_2648 family PIN domain-containing protein [Paracoccus saliphilus]|uniref:PIN domain-containing protein n=1 Tax=Paracoccus saliphilus TaxID=405559 RepID=A0AA46A4Y0_9RHOB|nr:PIN domain-containing protein [Paracoccus saliphilus]WCR05046.1 PIN domain-containing protein [Paracoccus saliphilus]SIS70865.1 PIN domain-containing protein [Paracoccus saliphilus]